MADVLLPTVDWSVDIVWAMALSCVARVLSWVSTVARLPLIWDAKVSLFAASEDMPSSISVLRFCCTIASCTFDRFLSLCRLRRSLMVASAKDLSEEATTVVISDPMAPVSLDLA